MKVYLSLKRYDEVETVVSEVINALRAAPSMEAAERLPQVEQLLESWVEVDVDACAHLTALLTLTGQMSHICDTQLLVMGTVVTNM